MIEVALRLCPAKLNNAGAEPTKVTPRKTRKNGFWVSILKLLMTKRQSWNTKIGRFLIKTKI